MRLAGCVERDRPVVRRDHRAVRVVPSLNTLATQSEPSFLATQLIVMVIFIALSVFAMKEFQRQRPPDSFTPHPLFEKEQ